LKRGVGFSALRQYLVVMPQKIWDNEAFFNIKLFCRDIFFEESFPEEMIEN